MTSTHGHHSALRRSARVALAVLIALVALALLEAPRSDVTETAHRQKNPRGVSGNWTQIWGDEFNGRRLNRNKWSNLRGKRGSEYGTPFNPSIESAFYKSSNVAVGRGHLALTLRRGRTHGFPYSSGIIHSGNHFGFRYGFVEARVKVPKCRGCWPAFWMLSSPTDSDWPPEIDIFEFFDTRYNRMAYFNYHYRHRGIRQTGIIPYSRRRRDFTGWHTFGLRRTGRTLQTYIDGRRGPRFRSSRFVTRKKSYLIFNLALQRGHRPHSKQRFLVDYVRVWRAGRHRR